MGRVENKVALVTGGAQGIGRAAGLMLAREGAKVAVTDVLDDSGKEVVREINAVGEEAEFGDSASARFWHLDVSDEQQVERVFHEVARAFGPPDILVNNAGISGVDKPTHELTAAEWQRVMDVNVNGVFFCTKRAIPYMKKAGGGSIINLSSIYGLIGAANVPPYHASKGAVRLMTKTDAMLYAPDQIRVNSIHPGFIWTRMVEEYGRSSAGDPDEFRKQLADLHPLGHIGDCDDIAYGILYLASDEAKFVTGSELVIDGGYTAR